MKKKISIFFIACLFAASFSITSAEEGVTLGYITGNKYLDLTETERQGWVVGAMDGIMAESFYILRNTNDSWLGRCIKGLPVKQIKAIFEKELQVRPDGWHAPAAFIFRQEIKKFCDRRVGG